MCIYILDWNAAERQGFAILPGKYSTNPQHSAAQNE